MKLRLSRRWTAFAGGLTGAITIIIAVLLLLTGTEAGRQRILNITLDALGGQVNGELTIDRLEGGLLTGARVYGIRLVDPTGREMVQADSAHIRYRVPTFFGGDIVIRELELFDAEVLLYRFPLDSLWNYQMVLQDTTSEDSGGAGRATIIETLRLIDSRVTVRLPWEPDDDLSEVERRIAIAAELSDSSRLELDSVAGGYLRTIRVETPATDLETLVVASDERGGMYLRAVGSTATVHLYRDIPLQVVGLHGELALHDGIVRIDAPTIQLPGSKLSVAGVIALRDDGPAYDLRIDADEVETGDVRWIHPGFPGDGQASFGLDIETRPGGLLMRMTDLAFVSRGTRMSGRFSVVLGDSMLFSDVSLRADPLDMGMIEEMLPMTIPVRGLRIGTVEIESPAS